MSPVSSLLLRQGPSNCSGGKWKGEPVSFKPDRKTSVFSFENMGEQLLCKDEIQSNSEEPCLLSSMESELEAKMW